VYVSWKESVLEKAEKLEQLRIIENGEKIKVAITKFDSIPIDTPEDAELVRNILQNK
jgi:3-deoxy-manno-octulosonate cytidylyltransferase (CMP-KDO synthetase)